MLIGTECVQLTKQEVRARIIPILDTLFHAQVALAAKDWESEKLAMKNGEDYKTLCYWDARERFDPFVEYIADLAVDLTTGWFWPKGRDCGSSEEDADDDDILAEEHPVPCGFATYYHKEIATKILAHADNVREYYEGTPLERTWLKFDHEIRESIAAYQRLVEGGERFTYGLVKTTSKAKKPKKKGKKQDVKKQD